MVERKTVIRGLELCAYDPDPGQELKEVRSCPECPYYRAGCSPQLIRDALALLKEQELEIKGLRKLVEWAVECDFGYDNLGDWWVDRFKSEIEGMSYTEGLIHLAKRYIEVFEEDSEDA